MSIDHDIERYRHRQAGMCMHGGHGSRCKNKAAGEKDKRGWRYCQQHQAEHGTDGRATILTEHVTRRDSVLIGHKMYEVYRYFSDGEPCKTEIRSLSATGRRYLDPNGATFKRVHKAWAEARASVRIKR